MLNTTYLGFKINIEQVKLPKPSLSQVIFEFYSYLCSASLFAHGVLHLLKYFGNLVIFISHAISNFRH